MTTKTAASTLSFTKAHETDHALADGDIRPLQRFEAPPPTNLSHFASLAIRWLEAGSDFGAQRGSKALETTGRAPSRFRP